MDSETAPLVAESAAPVAVESQDHVTQTTPMEPLAAPSSEPDVETSIQLLTAKLEQMEKRVEDLETDLLAERQLRMHYEEQAAQLRALNPVAAASIVDTAALGEAPPASGTHEKDGTLASARKRVESIKDRGIEVAKASLVKAREVSDRLKTAASAQTARLDELYEKSVAPRLDSLPGVVHHTVDNVKEAFREVGDRADVLGRKIEEVASQKFGQISQRVSAFFSKDGAQLSEAPASVAATADVADVADVAEVPAVDAGAPVAVAAASSEETVAVVEAVAPVVAPTEETIEI